jgi:hypothetical protein
MKKSRADALRDLVHLAVPLEQSRTELKQYPWDSQQTLVILSAGHVRDILERYLKGELTDEEVEEWANMLEMREDVEVQSELLKEVVFELANPGITQSLTQTRAGELVDVLARG